MYISGFVEGTESVSSKCLRLMYNHPSQKVSGSAEDDVQV